jgi:hypothetical protein
MGNNISMPCKQDSTIESISMSNGLTSVFIDVMVVSGSALACSDREKEFIIWLAQRDQSAVGIGTVSFDIDEMPWSPEGFEEEKSFLLKVITHGCNELGWDKLHYEPRKDRIMNVLLCFQQMIEAFDPAFINFNDYLEWIEIKGDESPAIPPGFPKCEEHDVFLSCFGCILCNNRS